MSHATYFFYSNKNFFYDVIGEKVTYSQFLVTINKASCRGWRGGGGVVGAFLFLAIDCTVFVISHNKLLSCNGYETEKAKMNTTGMKKDSNILADKANI